MIRSEHRPAGTTRLLASLVLLAASALALAGPVELFVEPDWTSAEALWLLCPLLPFAIASVAPLGHSTMRRVALAWLAAVSGYLLFGVLALVDASLLGTLVLFLASPLLVTLLVRVTLSRDSVARPARQPTKVY